MIKFEENLDDSEDNDDYEFNLILPCKYHNIKWNLLKKLIFSTWITI